MTPTLVDEYENGDAFDEYSVKVNVMQCDPCPDWAFDAAFEGLKHCHDQLYTNTSVPGTSLQQYTTDFSPSTSNQSTARQEANQWLDNNNFYSDELYLFVTGEELAVTWGLAWNGRCVGYVSYDGNYYTTERQMETMAVHESLHAYLNQACSDVQDLANSSNQVDHKLGHIGGYKNSDRATPMCASYASNSSTNYAGSGDCGNDESIDWGDWTTYLSVCTESGVDYTLDHAKGNH